MASNVGFSSDFPSQNTRKSQRSKSSSEYSRSKSSSLEMGFSSDIPSQSVSRRKRSRSSSGFLGRKYSCGLNKLSSAGTTTMEGAEEIKLDQGFHECEVSTCSEEGELEADLHIHRGKCKKNPGHVDFIPANKFSIEHLPLNYQDMVTFNLIKAVINLTVRVCSKFTSFDRPPTFFNIKQDYPFYSHRGRTFRRTGTGMVSEVHSMTDEFRKEFQKRRPLVTLDETCPCEQCKTSLTPKTQWYVVVVLTARHVVFDDSEAEHSTCQLFYDSEEHLNKIQDLKGATVRAPENIDHDISKLFFYSHDLELGKKLKDMLELYKDLHDMMHEKFSNKKIERPLAVIVSHPHGCNKQVTVGAITEREEVKGYDHHFRYTYTTQTCPGSSGAPVFIHGKTMFHSLHPHSKRCKKKGFNMSVVYISEWPKSDDQTP